MNMPFLSISLQSPKFTRIQAVLASILKAMLVRLDGRRRDHLCLRRARLTLHTPPPAAIKHKPDIRSR
jgi:hypothetical protein